MKKLKDLKIVSETLLAGKVLRFEETQIEINTMIEGHSKLDLAKWATRQTRRRFDELQNDTRAMVSGCLFCDVFWVPSNIAGHSCLACPLNPCGWFSSAMQYYKEVRPYIVKGEQAKSENEFAELVDELKKALIDLHNGI